MKDSRFSAVVMALSLAGTLWAGESDFPVSGPKGYLQLETDLHLGLDGGPTEPDFAADTSDWYGPNWRGLQIPLENARNYEERVDPFFMIRVRAGFYRFHLLVDLPLRRDMEAWYQDGLKKNFTYRPSELDINVPSNAYATWFNDVGYVRFGRFAVDDLKVSKNDILIGGAPYHDGIQWHFAPGIFRYDFLLSSLNAWLYGDVIDRSTGCPPEGTEAFAQKCTDPDNQVPNQRNRTYTENVKNLVYHRFGVETRKFWAYVIEESVVGGKELEFRSVSPFIYWHDNYATGYTSAMTSLEFGWKPMTGAKFYGQMNMEDLNSPVGEDDDKETSRSVINYMVGYYQELQTARYGKFSWRLDVVRTDPVANNSRLPLLKYTSRRNYRSNFREQDDVDYADAYFVDYPIGYRRGPDALDLWLDLGWKYRSSELSLTFAWLRQGDKEMYTDYNVALAANENLTSGIVETQYMLDALYRMQVTGWFSFYLGGGFRIYENLAHENGENGAEGWARLGVKFNFVPVDFKF